MKVVVCDPVRLGVVPVTVIVKEPAGVDVEVVIVKVLIVPLVVGVTGLGLNVALAPAGSPLALSVTGCSDPAVRVTVIVLDPVPLWSDVCVMLMLPELDSV